VTELTLAQIVQIARRWWWILLLGLCAGVVVGAALASRTEPVYQADAKLLLDRPTLETTPESSANAYNNILAAERLTQTFGQLVETRIVLSEALARIGPEAGDLTVDELDEALTVTVVPETQIIQIEFSGNDPQQAASVVNAVSAVFIEEAASIRPDVSNDNTNALQQSIDDIVADMAMIQADIADLEARADANSATVTAQLRDLRTLLGENQSRHAELVEIQQRMTISAAETGVLVKVVDPAGPPDAALSANPAFTVFLSVIGGLALAGAVVFVLGYLDNTVKEPAGVQRITGRSTLGLIPVFGHPERFEALTNLGVQSAEAFRTLRTNLQFATHGKVVRSLVMTGTRPGDGATTTAAYLAMVLAQGGQRVILVDADLRNPSLHRMVGLPNRSGLTNLLLGDSMEHVEGYLRKTDIGELLILTSGPLPPNPADLMNSKRMEDIVRHLELRADLVIFDCPALQFADALILTGMVSGSLFVVAAGKTRSNELAEAVSALDQTGRPIFGTVLNRVRPARDAHDSPGHLIPQAEDPVDADSLGRAPGRRRGIPDFLSR
jgi:non-specific protein-tyrosine kinase